MKLTTVAIPAAVLALAFTAAPAQAKTPPPVSITITTTCLVSGLLASDYTATATLTGPGTINLVSKNKGVLATAITLPASVDYFGPVGVKTDEVDAVDAAGHVVGSVQVHTPCVKAAQGQA